MVGPMLMNRKDSPAGKDNMTLPKPVLAWVDGVGSYLLVPGKQWRIGGPGGNPAAEIVVYGDLSRRAAEISRRGGRYLLHHMSTVGSPQGFDGTTLREGSAGNLTLPLRELTGTMPFRVGSVEFEFSQRHPLSASANLRVVSRQRTSPACNEIVLVADTCIFAATSAAHVVCPDATEAITLMVGNDGFWRAKGDNELKIDGSLTRSMVKIGVPCRLEVADTVIALEPIG